MGEEAARDAGEPPDQGLAIAEQASERSTDPGPGEHGDRSAIPDRVPPHGLARAMRQDPRREPAVRQRAGRRTLDPARGEHRLGEQTERELADRTGRGERRREDDLGAGTQVVTREQLRGRPRERDQQSHERLAIGLPQPGQDAASELSPLGSRGERLRELEQRDRAGRR